MADSKALPSRPAPAAAGEAEGLSDLFVKRNALFDTLTKKFKDDVASRPRKTLKVTLVTGPGQSAELEATSWETTPGQLLKNVAKTVAAEAVVAKVNGELWDLSRPLEENCKVSYLSSDDPEGRAVFWHSAAHLLGEVAEHQYGCLLSHGPPTATGFFYDMAIDPSKAVKEADWGTLESKAKKFAKEKQPYERVEVSKEDLCELFGYSKYKMHYIEQFVPDGGSTTVYRNGTLVDLCTGPHIANTRQIAAFKIKQNSSAYFLGDPTNDSLQRISGVAFAKAEQMKQWETFIAEAKLRDHQVIGKAQKLFWFSQMSPGSPFLLPHGTRIFNAIQAMLREQYWLRDYQEVQSPLMYDVDLWKRSGHWAHYQDDMFRVPLKNTPGAPPPSAAEQADQEKKTDEPKADEQKTAATIAQQESERLFALKPMNCPGHCLMFASEERSYRALPWRVADFSALHRNEASGALHGMTRVRKFQQDDAHIFCTTDQIGEELRRMFDFMTEVYGIFDFKFKLKLSTRPDSYLGQIEQWNDAEAQLTKALREFRGDEWELNPGDGAFYGPKIDVTINDALGREFQCATIQLDFQLPSNFNLLYRSNDTSNPEEQATKPEGDAVAAAGAIPQGMARPVMIHRAVIGSFERFFGIITEHFAGKWPFWLSPRQVMIIPVMVSAEKYATEVRELLHKARLFADVDFSGNTMPKKIRAAQIAQYNFTVVVGATEMEERSVNIRNRDDPSSQQKGSTISLDDFISKLKALKEERRLKNAL